MEFKHEPIMLNECLENLNIKPDGIYVDGTLGGAGHSSKIVERLKTYKGDFAIQSFNPLYIKKVKKLAPDFIRGILGTNEKEPTESAFNNFIIKKMPLNFMIKPDFISYYYKGLPLRWSKTANMAVLAWTVTSQEIADTVYKFADNIIFENFVPLR